MGVLLMDYKITYSVNEVMEILGLCRRSVIRYIKAKKLDAFKVGSQWRIFGESLKALIEGGTPHGD